MVLNADIAGFTLSSETLEAKIGSYLRCMTLIPSNQDRTNDTCELVYFNHFGLYPKLDRKLVQNGMACALKYYYEKEFPADQPEMYWFKCMSPALVLALLFAKDADLKKLCDWTHLGLIGEYCGGLEYQVPQIYLLMCNHLRTEPQPTDALEAELAKCRQRRPKLLYAAWVAAIRGTQAEYDKAMRESLKHFNSRKKPDLEATYPGEWIARSQTVVNLIAMREGKAFPDVPPELGCLLVTKDSVQLCE